MNTKVAAVTATSPFGSGTSQIPFTFTDVFARFDFQTAIGVTLSNDDLTVTNATTSGGGVQVMPLAAQKTGKYYYEITWTTVGGNTNGGIAVAPTGTDYISLLAQINTGPLQFSPGGVLSLGNGDISAYGSLTTAQIGVGMRDGDVIGIAMDLDNMAVWFKIVGGIDIGRDWNGGVFGIGAGSDPATNTLGIPLAPSLNGFVPFIVFNGESAASDVVFTANFGLTPFAISPNVPLGFEFWPVP